ncbi:MAG: hypothetical protein V4655_14845 [Bdellovibrionota bacterium]|nr:MAG: hypothetical protein EOP10_34785 [Pseudomonadota bacterium]
MRLHSLLLTLFILLIGTSHAEAANRFGLGVVIAGPTGLTAEYIYGKNRDVAASLGWGDDSFHLNLDHHWNQPNLIKADGVPINIYFGLGLRWISWNGRNDDSDNSIGLRLPVGIQHIFKEVPIQIFFELAPALILVDSTGFEIDLALGARYFF